jgi:hypothetical protein
MRRPLVKRSITARLCALMIASPALLSLPACTDLVEEPVSSFTPDRFFKTEAEIVAGLAAVYATLRNTEWGYYNLSQVTADEHIIPTRGQDWYDNGRWLELDKQQWTANSPGALDDINAAWTDAFGGVVRANTLLQYMADAPLVDSVRTAYAAEAKVLRAFYYYQLLDLFGGVPLVTDIELKTREKAARSAVFNFIVDTLRVVRTALPKTRPAPQHGRITRGVADAILANMYLNAGVFSKDAPASATSYNSCMTATFGTVSACQLAVNFADSVLNSGVYTLATDWRSNFTANNETSPELIFVVKHLNQPGIGLNFLYRALHYNQLNSPTPWNGFSTIADVYNAFDPNDRRREIFLVGPQINFDNGTPAKHRNGEPLVFTVAIGDETEADEDEGARIYKWPTDPNHVGEEHGNDFAYFRLAEIYLIKAEALLEMGRGAEALPLLNALRARVFTTPSPLAVVTRDVILNERLFELTAEAKRRQDLIRHGKYTSPWLFKPVAAAAHKILMPIPQSQLDANPKLTQNAGY